MIRRKPLVYAERKAFFIFLNDFCQRIGGIPRCNREIFYSDILGILNDKGKGQVMKYKGGTLSVQSDIFTVVDEKNRVFLTGGIVAGGKKSRTGTFFIKVIFTQFKN